MRESPRRDKADVDIQYVIYGAGRRIRTDDLLITNQLLYQLSYAGEKDARH